MQSKISIIVPVFNVERYIAECLTSLIKQTFKDIEIVIVDDGSTDNSYRIIEDYAHDDNRIKVIRNQINKGVSASRNIGLKEASSNYIMFCDPDDYYHEDMCKIMYLAIISNVDVDLAVCDTNIIYDGGIFDLEEEKNYKLSYTGKHIVNDKVIDKTNICVWNKIYKKNIIEKNNICFPENLLYEDNYFFIAYALFCKNFYYVNQKLYFYRKRQYSIMYNTQKNKLNLFDKLEVSFKIYLYAKKKKILNEHINLVFNCIFSSVNWILERSDDKDIQNIIRKKFKEFIKVNILKEEYQKSIFVRRGIRLILNKKYIDNEYFFKFIRIENNFKRKKIFIYRFPIIKIYYFYKRPRIYLLNLFRIN